MNLQTFEFKRDEYLVERGGGAHFLDLYCDHCGRHLLLYQKDNPGKLKRLYLDRIVAPEGLVALNELAVEEIPQLRCEDCGRLIAVAEGYDMEPRKVYLLLSFATINEVSEGVYPPAVERLDLKDKK